MNIQPSYFPRQKKAHAILKTTKNGKKRANGGVAYEGKMGTVPFYPRKKII